MNDNKKFTVILAVIIAILGMFFSSDNKSYSTIIEEIKDKIDLESSNTNGDLEIYFLDVGQADSILIRNEGKNALIDAGNNKDGDKLVKYFKSLGISNFDYVVGTHAHEDHIGGMDNIIREFNIDTFYMPDAITTTRTFEEVLDALEKKNYAFNTPLIDDEFIMGDCKFKVLNVSNEKGNLNNTSIVLHMKYGNKSFLFTGDAEKEVEKKILDKNIKSDVLKVGHHGSDSSSTSAFLDKVDPEIAIIETGKNNIYHHPHKVTLDKLNKRNIKIYRTDEDGTIHLTSDGNNINIDTIKTDTNG